MQRSNKNAQRLIYPGEEAAVLGYFGIGFLSIREAAEILHADHPNRTSKYWEKSLVSAFDKGALYLDFVKYSDEQICVEKSRLDPGILETWCAERDIELGEHYEEFVEREEQHLRRLEAAYQAIRADGAAWDAGDTSAGTIAALREENQKLKMQIKEKIKGLGLKEQTSLLKLVIGLAMCGYRYKPRSERNPMIKDIENDLRETGVPLSADTIRYWLREAETHLP